MLTDRNFSLGRRDFLKIAGATMAGAALTSGLRAEEAPAKRGAPGKAQRTFEVNANLYAWDLHDEGVERILDNLQEMTAINSVYLLGVMHPERRPFREGDFPHNPQRKVWQVEDARCYWHPDAKRYGRVKPRLSDHAWLNEKDWLRILTEAARKRGLRVGMELSHALIDVERMAGPLADMAQRNFHGEVTTEGQIKWLRPPCPNHPDTLDLVVGMTTDVVANHGLDYVSSCIMCYDASKTDNAPMIGGCFCEHCRKVARGEGLDLEQVRKALVADPAAQPALGEWVAFRERTVARFYERIHAAMHAIKPGVDLRYNLHSPFSYRSYGINPTLMQPHLDSMRWTDYVEQEGDPKLPAEKLERMKRLQKMVPKDFPLHAAVAMRLKATPELVKQGIKNVVDLGMVGMTASHYDGARFEVMRAVRPGLVEAGIRIEDGR